MEIKDHINQLRNILNEHNINYYVNDNPSISDNEYDVLLKKLELLKSKIRNTLKKILQRKELVDKH